MTIEQGTRRIILASQSQSRRRMLQAAGLTFETVASSVDEPKLRVHLEKSRSVTGPETIARELAAAKAIDVSLANPAALVIGGDQVLALGQRIFEKPADLMAARQQLSELRGKQHKLVSAVVLAVGGVCIWSHAEAATMSVRAFTPSFLDGYLEQAGTVVCQSVGAYQLEGSGAQLFERIEGDYFTILGLPLIALLCELRAQGALAT
jgi:septum formation protein